MRILLVYIYERHRNIIVSTVEAQSVKLQPPVKKKNCIVMKYL